MPQWVAGALILVLVGCAVLELLERIFAFLVVLVFYAIVSVAIAAALAVLAGWALAHLERNLREQVRCNARPNLATFDDGRLLLWNERKDQWRGTLWIDRRSIAVVTMWFLGGLALYMNASGLDPASPIPQGVLFVVSAALLVPLLMAASGRISATAVGPIADRAREPIRVEAISEWQPLLNLAAGLRALAGKIGVTRSPDPSVELAKFVAANQEAVLSNSKSVEDFASGMRRALESELKLFEKATSVHARNAQLLKQVTGATRAARRPSLLDMLDDLIQRHEQVPNAISNGAWERFFDEADEIKSDLEDLLHHVQQVAGQDNADALQAPHASSSTSPYAVLGLPPGASRDQIEAIYRRLVNIYHPDKGLVKEDGRFKEIDAAYRQLCGRRS